MFLKRVPAAVRDWLVKVEFITVGLWNVKMKTMERENKSNYENTGREIKGGKVAERRKKIYLREEDKRIVKIMIRQKN